MNALTAKAFGTMLKHRISNKKMKTKWGSCTPEHKRIWINLELAKKSLHCLEYVLVHEMIQIVEKNHTEKFRSLLNKFMPNWLQFKEKLKRGKLGHFTWDYETNDPIF